MCYSRCPYENHEGECTITRFYAADAHCADVDDEIFESDNVDDPFIEAKIGGDR